MPKQSLTYRLGYFVDGEISNTLTDSRRMGTIDSQLRGLYEIIGNGVLDGWEVGRTSDAGLSVAVSSGKGIISFVVVENTDSVALSLFPGMKNYVYANRLAEKLWSRQVAFSVSVSEVLSPDVIPLAVVTTSATAVTSIDQSVRTNVGLVTSVENAVKNHRHVGGTNNPEPVDLGTQVEGTLSQENIPSLDASKVQTGKLAAAVIPKIDHVTGLTSQGELTHPQLDAFVQNLAAVGKTVMGETALVNLLQLVLALKHQWPEVDAYLVNQLSFIPGISPDAFIDFDNTTAEVDTRTALEGGQHKIYGSTGPGSMVFTKTWDSEAEFVESGPIGIDVVGDLMRLKPTETSVMVDDFESLGNWETRIDDISSEAGTLELDATTKVSGARSAKVGVNTADTSNITFTMRKTFAAQDWSSYDRIVFWINTANVEHGNLYFYVNDAVAGVQESYTLVLGANEPTINRDTLVNGWREVTVDLSPFERGAINNVGFFMSTQYGWDPTRQFTMNVDKMTLTMGNKFTSSGNAVFTYGNGFPQDFWRVRWDAVVPAGAVLKARTRASNSLADFDEGSPTQAAWSQYSTTNGFEFQDAGGELYSYAQVEVVFEASLDKTGSPELVRLYLDRRVSADSSGFSYDDEDQWTSGNSYNVDASSEPGSIKIASLADVDNVFYGSDGAVHQGDADMNELFSSTGNTLPLSTRQALAGATSGLGQVSAVKRGENDTIWVADTDNDRVLQVDKSGNIVFGLWGSFLTEPVDTYGDEEQGPGSNKDAAAAPAEPDTSTAPKPLYAVYNPTVRKLWVVFSQNLETVNDAGTTFNKDNMFMRVGANRVYFGGDTGFSLFGIDEAKYAAWAMSTNQFLKQFTFYSHVLEARLSQADGAVLESAASFDVPSMAVADMDENELVDGDNVDVTFVTPNCSIGGESSDNNGIRTRINGGSYSYHRSRTVSFDPPEALVGPNLVEATIVDGNNNPLAGEEASCSLTFVLDDGSYANEPAVSISSPKQGQTVASLPTQVEFEARNHPVLPVGSCVQYSVDGGAWTEHRETTPISIASLDGGRHSVSIRLVDDDGNPVDGESTSATVTFNQGSSADFDISLYVGAGTIRGAKRQDTAKNTEATLSVAVANVHFANMFCPVDLQLIEDETSQVNPGGEPTVLVAKLRSQSSTTYLADAPATSQISAPDDSAIFSGPYMDGHSVVQYGMDGGVLFSNNAAKFSDTRANAKVHLGSASKVAPGDLAMADSIRQRAIMTRTELDTGKTAVTWEYLSDRLVADFQPVATGTRDVSVSDSSCDQPTANVKPGTIVRWTNASSVPVKIVSGSTTPALFAADPDLTLYGDEFVSPEIQPGGQYARRFSDVGQYPWFAYPNIVTGVVSASSSGTSKDDTFMMVEKDPVPSVGGGRVSKVNSWGKIVWSFGDGMLYDPKDVRMLAGDSIIIST